MSVRAPVTAGSAVGVGAPAAGGSSVLSTRDAILQRYAGGRGGAATSAAAQPKMELFESGEPEAAVDNAPVTHSRSLLLGGSSAGLSASKKLGSSHVHASGVEDVDCSTRIRPALAFQHFAGALYTGAGGRSASGAFESGPSALLVAGKGASSSSGAQADSHAIRLKFENPFVKLQRLQEELREFDAELKAAAAQQPQTDGAASATQDMWSNLAGNVQQLQGQLDSVLGQPQVQQLMQQHGGAQGTVAAAVSPTAGGSLLPQFDSLFDAYVAELTANPSFQPFPAPATAAPADAASSQSAASSAELAALPKLDERLHALEKLLGTSAGAKAPTIPLLASSASAAGAAAGSAAPAATAAPSVLPAPDLVSALSSLHAQLVSLTPQRLELVSRSCKQILIEQESIALNAKQSKDDAGRAGAAASDKKDDAAAATGAAEAGAQPYAAQVSHLYALTSRWDALSLTLPTLIARLSSLHALHSTSATLVARVSELERQSGAIDAALTAQRDGVQAVAQAAKDNLAAMHANFKAMDARIAEINKKMEQLK